MKIVFIQPKKTTQELEIEPTISAQECKSILIDKYQWPPGEYKFIYNGKILSSSAPFEKISPGSHIIVFIKATPQRQNSNTSQLSSSANSLPSTQSSTPSQPLSSSQPVQPSGPGLGLGPQGPRLAPQGPRLGPQGPRLGPLGPGMGPGPRGTATVTITRDQVTQLIQNHLRNCNVEQMYNPEHNIFQHPEALANIEQIVFNNPGIFSIVEDEIIANHSAAARFGGTQIDTIASFMGAQHNPIPTVTHYDVQVQAMSDQQRAGFQRMLQLGHDKNVTLDTYIACNYNEEQTRTCLSEMD